MSTLKTDNIESLDTGGVIKVDSLLDRVINVTSIAAMEAYSAPVGYVFSLNAGGRSGTFDVVAGDFSTELAADPLNGIYIGLSDDTDATTKVAKRRIENSINVQWWGAVGDGVTNDNDAFHYMTQYVNSIGGGHIIVPAVSEFYKVCRQEKKNETEVYSRVNSIMDFVGCSNLTIDFAAKLKFADGLRFGSFDPATGDVHNAPSGGFWDSAYASSTGNMLDFHECDNVIVNNPNFDGNSENFIVGGYWDDSGIQLPSSGLYATDTTNIVVNNAITDGFGLDGLYITAYSDNFKVNGIYNNCKSRYNGRQGLSITAGTDLQFNNCEFSYTGRGGIQSSPSAGVDIESDVQTIRRITFNGCVFSSNVGQGFLCIRPNLTSEIFLNKCILHGTTQANLWDFVGAIFRECTFLGFVNNAKGSKFYNCLFSDKDLGSFTGTSAGTVFANGNANTLARDCTFEITKAGSELYIDNDLTLEDCTYYVRLTDPALQERVGVIRPIKATNFNIVADYTFTAGNTGVDVNGDHTYINVAGTSRYDNWKGTSELIGGTDLAWFDGGGSTAFDIPLIATDNSPVDYLSFTEGGKIYSHNFTNSNTSAYTDLLKVPYVASCIITIGGAENSNGKYGLHLSHNYSIADLSRVYHGTANVIYNYSNKGMDTQWKASTGYNEEDSRILQVKTQDSSADLWVVKVEMLSRNESNEVEFLI